MKKLILGLCIAGLMLTGCSSKPSKGEIEDALKKSAGSEYSDASKSEREKFDDYFECMIDETYDDVSAKSWKKMMEADPDEDQTKLVTSKEEKALNAAADKCIDELE